MGCSSSDAHVQSLQIKSTFPNIMITNKKPSVWLIGGGPGCEKGKICEYLIRDYKFKYLSSYDMVQFQQERGGADAELILRLFKEKKKMPSDLIVRLVKKAIASCGIRRFLIDGFPNSIQDVSQFDKQLTDKQINFYGYLNIKISQKKMIQSGIQAYSEDKSKQKADIQLNVREIVKIYQNQSQKIKKQYQKKNKYHQIDGQQGGDKTYVKVKSYLQSLSIQQLKPVHVFFSHFDDISHQTIFCDDLARKYGIYIYSPRQLISEALSKSYTTQSQVLKKLQKQNKQVPASIVLSLIRKKIQKQDYRGRFLFAGYPRNISDAQEWDKHFGWETDILGYLSFQIPNEKFRKVFTQVINKSKPNLKSQQINKQFEKYQSNQKQICDYYQKQKKLLLLDAQNQQKALSDIHKFFQQKNIIGRKRISMTKLVFVSTLCGNGSIYAQIAQKRGAKVLKMQNIMQQKIDQNGLYSQLIQSFIKIGKPVSGAVASRILVQKIMQQKTKNLILVEGFPNSQQQLQSWQQQVGQCFQVCLLILYSHNNKSIQQKVKQKIKDKKIMAQQKDVIQLVKQNSIKIQQRLKKSDWKYHIVNPLDDPSKIQGIFDNSGFK